MEEASKKNDQLVPIDPMPENASVTPVEKAKKIAWLSLFEMVGLSKLGEHLHEEREYVKKVPLIIFLCLVAGVWLRGCWDDSKLESVKDDLVKSDGAKLEAERDRDKYQIESQNADNALAPWKELANSQFPGKPINEGLNSLLQKVDALQKAMLDNSLNPLKEPIASAVATVTVNLKTVNPRGNSLGPGGIVAFGRGPNGLLIGGVNQMQGWTTPDGISHYRIAAPCQSDDTYMGKPVESLSDAQYIQIDLSAIPPNTDILGGSVVWVINSRITLKFDIPPQRSSSQSHLMIGDLSSGMSVLRGITPPSSTTDTSTSQP
jgi:hypothetical protein